MAWYLSAIGLIVHVYFWGAGLAVLALPRPLRRLWPLVAPAAGLGLQSAVVSWAGLLPLAGTDAYAVPALLIPCGLGWLAWQRAGPAGRRRLLREPARLVPLAAIQLGVLVMMLWPLARSGLPLTAVSLGSCDAADYAAGVRVFKEFRPDDRTGFLGQEEVVSVGEIRDLRTLFVRLNHLGPCAAMALNASILRLEAHQIVSLFTATLAALIVPGVFLLGRGVFRFSAAGAGVLALAIGTSPVLAYAVHHTAAAQLMATMAAALLAWVGIRAFDTTRRGLAFRRWLLLAVTAVWLVAGTYNFLLPALLAPPALWVAMRSWRTRRLRHGLAWAGFVCAAAAVVALLFPARFIAIGQRMLLFEEYDFGWRIPALRPDGWIGAVGNARLEPASGPMVAAAVVVLLVSLWSFLPGRGTRSRALSALVCFAGVPLAGYGIFLLEAHAKGNNASYDAYKLLSVFLPMIVGGMCPWLGFGPREPMLRRGVAAAAACLLVGLNLAGARHFQRAMAHPPLAVEADLLDLGRIEEMPQVDGINLRVDQFWSRLWANALLLKKRQYFPSHTYEGRRPTELLGNFDLVDAMARPGGIAGTGVVLENDSFALIDRRESARLEIGFGPGWYGLERYGSESWRWSASSPVIEVDNRTDASLRANLVLDLLPAEPRDLRVVWRGRELIRRELALERTTVHAGPVDIPPGRSELRLESSLAPTPAPAGDPRLLLVRLFAIRIDVARGD